MTRYVVLATETTGISPERDRIVWVAVAILEHRTVTERWSTFLDPGPNSRVRVAGIDLAGQPTFADVALQLTDMLHGGVLVAHNAPPRSHNGHPANASRARSHVWISCHSCPPLPG